MTSDHTTPILIALSIAVVIWALAEAVEALASQGRPKAEDGRAVCLVSDVTLNMSQQEFGWCMEGRK